MANRSSRPSSRARRRAVQRRRQLIVIGGIALAVLVALAVILLLPKKEQRDQAPQIPGPEPTAAPIPEAVEEEGSAEDAVPDSPQATPQVGSESAARRAQTRPTPTAEGFIPVFSKANTDEKIIAITVDDCYQAENLQQIVDAAISANAKLTIFPIGENVRRKRQGEILKYAWENGFELENHTYTHNGLYGISNEALAEEVYKQQLALCEALGVEYQCHFLRPMGGDARHDQRMQMYAKQLGYYGIAHWSVSGRANNSTVAKGLQPGAIYLFHTTDKDRDKLLKFIPWVAEQGYQMVTLNEMFGYPENETSPLQTPIRDHVIPQLEPYQMVYVPLKKTSYNWEAYLLQEKLIQMGYLTGEPDGIYGESCEAAVKAWQKANGLPETGELDAETVQRIIEGTVS